MNSDFVNSFDPSLADYTEVVFFLCEMYDFSKKRLKKEMKKPEQKKK